MLVLSALSLIMAVAPGAASAASKSKIRKGPAGLRFYNPPKSLPGKTHGDVIWARKLTGGAALKNASSNTLVLYRSIGVQGTPVAVSGTVSIPKGKAPKKGWPVITYAHGTTGIADSCAPSRSKAGTAVAPYNTYVYPLLQRWLKAGYAVVRTDYEGLGTPGVHPYLVGTPAGRSVLDMARAAHKLDPRISKRVAISGHSQGGHAALWAAALAKKWTPDLSVRGTVAFAPASHIEDQVPLVEALTSPNALSGLVGLIGRGIDTAKPSLAVAGLLGDRARALYPQTLSRCVPALAAANSLGGVAPADIFRDGANKRPLISALGRQDPSRLKVGGPVLIEQGLADTTVFPSFTTQLDGELRKKGGRVTYKTFPGVSHGGIVTAGAGTATAFLRSKLK